MGFSLARGAGSGAEARRRRCGEHCFPPNTPHGNHELSSGLPGFAFPVDKSWVCAGDPGGPVAAPEHHGVER